MQETERDEIVEAKDKELAKAQRRMGQLVQQVNLKGFSKISMENTQAICTCLNKSIKCKNIFTKMLKDVGIEVPKSIETRSKCSMHADKGRG